MVKYISATVYDGIDCYFNSNLIHILRFHLGNSQYLKELLDRFEDPRHVPNWSNQGAILLDYLDITAKVRRIISASTQIPF